MAVYVDDMQLPARAGGRDSAWSHLFAGTYEQLLAFAAGLGLRRAWFQEGNRPRLGDYDVTAGKRQQAFQLCASPVTFREAGQVIRARAQAGSRSQGKEGEHAPAHGRERAGLPEPGGRDEAPTARREHKDGAGPKRHSWDKRDDYHKTCRDCGIKVLARPHPYERRWYSEYTTTDGRCFVADRVPPCEPAAQPRPAPEDVRARHASELDRAAGRAWQHGDLQRAARLIADARALDPARAHLWAKREAAIVAAAPRSAPSTQAASAGHGRTCNEPHPHQDAYLATRRSREIGDTRRCHDGHPVSDLRHDVAARLIAAGFTASSPELARIREWNRAALDRAGIRPVGEDKEAETA